MQLTDASWNCQYPAPAADTLITTCTHNKHLDVFELPLDGEVPSAFGTDRLREEIDLASRRVEELLLYRHLLSRESAPAARRLTMMRLLRLHLAFDEFDAAAYYARHVAALKDPATAGISRVLAIWIEHRRALRARERGQIAPEFRDEEHARLAELQARPPRSAAAVAMTHVVASEIADGVGDKAAAQRELAAVALEEVDVPSVLQAYYDRADALYRELDDGGSLAAACRRLALHPALGEHDRLRYARAWARALVRGLPFDEADAILVRERAALADDSDLAFAVDLGRAVLAVRGADPPLQARQDLLALYHRQTSLHRRRAVMLDAVSRASDVGADRVIEALVQAYVDAAPPGTAERRRAERLYRRVMLGRAYRRRGEGRIAEARADFEAVAAKTGAYEGYIESLELRIKAGERVEQLAQEYRRRAHANAPLDHFLEAYLIARQLPKLGGAAHKKAVSEALAQLRASWPELKRRRIAQALFGAIVHEQYLTTGDVAAAQRANQHYLVALDLVGSNPRYAAMLLGQLGMLHAQVGNYRIALDYLRQRERLPYAENGASLAVRLALARTLLHVGHEAEAATAADEAVAMLANAPRLAPYRVLALDRAALYNLAAGRFARALALYDEEMPLLDGAQANGRTRMVVRLARAAAALGVGDPRRALADLAAAGQALDTPHVARSLSWPYASNADVVRAYRIIAAGLAANAHRRLGELEAAGRALEQRRALFKERLARNDRDEDLRALALVDARLADNARDRGDQARAADFVGRALGRAATVLSRTKAPVDNEHLDVLWMAAALRIATGVKLPFNVTRELRRAYERMVAAKDPTLRSYQRWFEVYLALLSPLKPRGHAAADDVADPMDDQDDQAPLSRTRPSPASDASELRADRSR